MAAAPGPTTPSPGTGFPFLFFFFFWTLTLESAIGRYPGFFSPQLPQNPSPLSSFSSQPRHMWSWFFLRGFACASVPPHSVQNLCLSCSIAPQPWQTTFFFFSTSAGSSDLSAEGRSLPHSSQVRSLESAWYEAPQGQSLEPLVVSGFASSSFFSSSEDPKGLEAPGKAPLPPFLPFLPFSSSGSGSIFPTPISSFQESGSSATKDGPLRR